MGASAAALAAIGVAGVPSGSSGTGGGALGGATSRAYGTQIASPQAGHFALRPALSSAVRSKCWQWGHENSMGKGLSATPFDGQWELTVERGKTLPIGPRWPELMQTLTPEMDNLLAGREKDAAAAMRRTAAAVNKVLAEDPGL